MQEHNRNTVHYIHHVMHYMQCYRDASALCLNSKLHSHMLLFEEQLYTKKNGDTSKNAKEGDGRCTYRRNIFTSGKVLTINFSVLFLQILVSRTC